MKESATRKPNAAPLSGHFTITPNPVVKGHPAIFHITVFTAPESVVLKVVWDFGDGTTSTSLIGIHTYQKAGTYEATLRVTDNNGNTSATKRKVRVIKRNKQTTP
ncbi:MAG: PKD domain-containing protein [Candidatus Freyarchaeota archaeon]|nr:PKD domain-containing protein [Candidatus Jordarchaeia archaeon]